MRDKTYAQIGTTGVTFKGLDCFFGHHGKRARPGVDWAGLSNILRFGSQHVLYALIFIIIILCMHSAQRAGAGHHLAIWLHSGLKGTGDVDICINEQAGCDISSAFSV